MESFIIIHNSSITYTCTSGILSWIEGLHRKELTVFLRVSMERKPCNLRCSISSQIVCKAHGLLFTEKQLQCCTRVYRCITVSQRITAQFWKPSHPLGLYPVKKVISHTASHVNNVPLLKLFSILMFKFVLCWQTFIILRDACSLPMRYVILLL